jgi:predicted nuclease of restriction endonuclease-like (RecB) superfamily
MKLAKKTIYTDVKAILEQAKNNAIRSVNFSMVIAYWKIGERIVEEELNGKSRAGYGEKIIRDLSARLTKEYGKGFTVSNIKYMRQFYTVFPIGHAVRGQSKKPTGQIGHAMRDQFTSVSIRDVLRPELSWTHYRTILKVESADARKYYMNEAADNNWSTRVLERQVNSHYYERLLSSKNKKPLRGLVKRQSKEDKPSILDFVKDPYVLEFLSLKPNATLFEKNLETELLNKLQQFLLEMGKGFSFVERQQRISADGEDFYIDLVFYNYILKCFVLLDLKTGKLTHQDIGQMDFYMRFYEAEVRQKSDNPTIGLILCAEKNDTIVKYSVLNENKRLFASKYKLHLPTEKELAKELRAEINSYNRKKGSKN